jgi:hypothetical protein
VMKTRGCAIGSIRPMLVTYVEKAWNKIPVYIEIEYQLHSIKCVL